MDFDFTEDQKLFRDSFRELLDKEFAPIVDERDKKGSFTKEEAVGYFKKLKTVGVSFAPDDMMELLRDITISGIVAEEMGYVWPSLASCFFMNCFAPIMVLASDEIRDKFLPTLNRGELLCCNGISEPNSGSDQSFIQTKAVLDGDEYVINGQKTWITNAPIADICNLYAIDGETGRPAFFLVDREASPYQTTELHKIGERNVPTGELFFDDCRIPKENNLMVNAMKRISEAGGDISKIMGEDVELPASMLNMFTGFSSIGAMFSLPRAWMALRSAGISQAALDASIKYAKERVQFDKPIGKTQLIQEMLFNMTVATESSRFFGYRALNLFSKGDVDARKASSLAKGYACESAVRVTYDAIQIHGGNGLSEDYPLERYFRDARMLTIPDGTTEIQKLVVGREIMGKGMSAYW